MKSLKSREFLQKKCEMKVKKSFQFKYKTYCQIDCYIIEVILGILKIDIQLVKRIYFIIS